MIKMNIVIKIVLVSSIAINIYATFLIWRTDQFLFHVTVYNYIQQPHLFFSFFSWMVMVTTQPA